MGLDIFSSLVVVITITMIVVNIGGLMYWWNITLNAVSLVNLVMVSTFQEFIYLNIRNTFFPNSSSQKSMVGQGVVLPYSHV